MEEKSPEMEEFLEKVSTSWFGRSRQGARCVTCGSEKVNTTDFKDAISLKEWSISKMCQRCQDATFVEQEFEREGGGEYFEEI